MASSSAVRAGQAYVEVGTDNGKLNAGLRSAGDRLKAWGGSVALIGAKIAGVGGVITGLFTTASSQAAKMGAELVGMSERTGFSVEALSELKFATAEVGTSMTALESAAGRLGKTMLNAIQGNKEARQAFANLGLSVADLQGLQPEKQFEVIAQRLSAVNDPSLRAAAAMEIFGTAGAELLPLLNKGAAGIEALRQKARDLGLSMSGEDALAAKEYGDGIRSLSNVIGMAWAKLGRAAIPIAQTVVPIFVDFTKVLTDAAKVAGDWFASNQKLVLWAVKIGAAIVAAGTAIVAIGSVLGGLGTILGVVAGGFATLGTVVSIVMGLIGAVLSPIGLLLAGLAALVGYLLYSSGALETLSSGFQTLKTDATAAFGGIADALKAGDIGMAMKVLWSVIKLEWTRGTNWISEIWDSMTSYLVDRWAAAQQSVSSFFIKAWGGLQMIFIEIISGFLRGWIHLCNTMGDIWERLTAGFEIAWLQIRAKIEPGLNMFEEANKIAEAAARRKLERDKAWDADIASVNREAQGKSDFIADDTQSTLDAMRAKYSDDQKKRSAARGDGAATALAELNAAKSEFEASLQEAKDKRTAVEKKNGVLNGIKGSATGAALGAQAAAGAQFAGVAGPQVISGVSGTFSAAAVGRLSDSSVPAKQLEELKTINENLVDIKKNKGPQFAP